MKGILFTIVILLSVVYIVTTDANYNQELWSRHFTNGTTELVHRLPERRQIKLGYSPAPGQLLDLRYENAQHHIEEPVETETPSPTISGPDDSTESDDYSVVYDGELENRESDCSLRLNACVQTKVLLMSQVRTLEEKENALSRKILKLQYLLNNLYKNKDVEDAMEQREMEHYGFKRRSSRSKKQRAGAETRKG